MAYAKKTTKNEAYQKLKTDLKEGNPLGNAYLFYGEESYLREYYLGEIRKRLIPAGFEEFNYHALEGKDLTAQSLTEMAEAMPMMAERTLIVVTDWDIYKLNEDQRERFIALLEDLPEYCTLIFIYDTLDYKRDGKMKKLCARAGVDAGKVFPHNLRHLFATAFYRAYKDIVKLADVLGHSSIETTRIYLVTSAAEHRRQLEQLKLVS